MRPAGYTLVELLVVISIISILSVVGFVNFKGFSQSQVADEAAGQIQTYLRLAQSNATSSTVCGSSGSTTWSVIFNSGSLSLACGSGNTVQKTLTLENARISSIIGSGCNNTEASLPFTATYASGTGVLTFAFSEATQDCLASSTWTFTATNTLDTSKTKSFNLSKGGAIDVQ